MSKKRRKRPVRHTVHTKDPRYNVKNYPRGSGDLVTRHGVTKTQHAWDVDDGMVASPIYDKPTDAWRADHNRSDVVDVDYHRDRKRAEEKFTREMKRLNEQRQKGKITPEEWHTKTGELAAKYSPHGSLFDDSKKKKTFPPSKTLYKEKYVLKGAPMSGKKLASELHFLNRLGIRYDLDRDGDKERIYVHEADYNLRIQQVVPEKPSKDAVERFKKKYKIHEEDWKDPFKGLVMNDDKTMGLVVEPKEVFKDLPTDPYKGRVSTFINVDLPITARSDHIKVRSVKGKDRKAGHYEMIMVGNNVVQANKLREAISIVGQDDIIFRAERKDYPIAIQNSKGDTIMLAPLVGMTSKEEEKNLPRLENLEGVESTRLTE